MLTDLLTWNTWKTPLTVLYMFTQIIMAKIYAICWADWQLMDSFCFKFVKAFLLFWQILNCVISRCCWSVPPMYFVAWLGQNIICEQKYLEDCTTTIGRRTTYYSTNDIFISHTNLGDALYETVRYEGTLLHSRRYYYYSGRRTNQVERSKRVSMVPNFWRSLQIVDF